MKKYCLFIPLVILIAALSGCAATMGSYSAPSSDRPPLHQAALHGKLDKLKQLLSQGVNINELDSGGFGAMHWAATTPLGSGPDMIRALIAAGGNPNIRQKTAQMTPLFFASNGESVKALIEGGADVNARDINQGTPLHSAKSADAVTVLINNGADVNAKNSQGQTPRMAFETTLSFMKGNTAYSSLIGPIKQKIQALDGNAGQQTGSYDIVKNDFTTKQAKKKSSRAAITERIERMDKLIASQPCKMKHSQWIYTGETCINATPEGSGSAVHKELDLRFEGKISLGAPVYGTLFENDTNIYEGDFMNGDAHGNGVCFYRNEPEECRYFKGKRIDTLYKQRQEFQRQQTMAKNTVKRQSAPQPKAAPAESNTLGDAVQDQLFEQGAKFIFNQLF